ncbi:MAG TPA: acetyl-CoA carboxylase biotin carboxyl carrier protein [Pyrinomonadaceae bacterium]|jgi:acetyl-CoA carboxylase biotin carboxyl carrier protein
MSDQETLPTPGNEQSQKARPSERVGGRERSRRRHHPQQNQPRHPEASLNMDELRELVELIAKHGFTDFELEREGFRVRLGRELPAQMQTSAPASSLPQQMAATGQTSAGPTASASQSYVEEAGGGVQAQSAALDYDATILEAGAQPQQQGAAPSEDEGLHIIPSPIVGTFYRSPSPTAEPFVRLGSQVNPDTVVCIIEAMKLMNEILAEMSGEVVKIYVENGQPVEYNQPLFGIKK